MHTIIGTCLGVKPITRGNGDKAFTQQTLGISIPMSNDAFGQSEVIQVVIGEKVYSDKLAAEFNKKKGNEIQVAVMHNHKVWRGNVQPGYYFIEELPAPNYVKTAA